MIIKTVAGDQIEDGAVVGTFQLAGGTKIPAVVVGEEGRGRQLGVLAVQLRRSSYEEWEKNGKVTVQFGRLGQTRSGNPKLIETEEPEDSDLLLVLLTSIGFRGSNEHQFPPGTEVVVEGRIAQGTAGRMGNGAQYVVRVPAGTDGELVVKITGRRYGQPSLYVYRLSNGDVRLAYTDLCPDIDLEDVQPL